MEIVELFKDSLAYPTKDWNKLLIFGAIIVILSIVDILVKLGILVVQQQPGVISILSIISFILAVALILIVSGYTLSITRKSINNVNGDVPALDLVKNIVDGIKVLILNIVYYIIPVIITFILALATNAFSYLYQMFSYIITYGSNASSAMPQELLVNAGFSFLIVFLVGGIFFLVFTLLFLVAKAVLAETESLAAAINIVDVFKKIGEISWGNYIIWLILVVIILFVISLIGGFVALIPFAGAIIALLVVEPYVGMFFARALGLIYNESKE